MCQSFDPGQKGRYIGPDPDLGPNCYQEGTNVSASEERVKPKLHYYLLIVNKRDCKKIQNKLRKLITEMSSLYI